MTNSSFKQLCLMAMGSFLLSELDRLTVEELEGYTGLESKADEFTYLPWLQKVMIDPKYLQDLTYEFYAKQGYVNSILVMFQDEAGKDLKYSEDVPHPNKEGEFIIKDGKDMQGQLIIDWDLSKPILLDLFKARKWFYALAGCKVCDMAMTAKNEAGEWITPELSV